MPLLPSSQPKVTITLLVDGKRYTRTIPFVALRPLLPEGWGPIAAARLTDLVREAGLL